MPIAECFMQSYPDNLQRNVNFCKYSMCLCENVGPLKESGQYSTLAPIQGV